MATLRFGVVGLGRAGTGMVGALAKHPDIQLTKKLGIIPKVI